MYTITLKYVHLIDLTLVVLKAAAKLSTLNKFHSNFSGYTAARSTCLKCHQMAVSPFFTIGSF